MKLTDLDRGSSGTALLDELHAAITRYVILPSPETADAVTLFIAASHAQPAWEHATRLVVKSPLKRCGKTRLLEVCRETCHRPLPTSNTSVAAVARSISEDDPPTLIHDEADTVFGSKEKRQEGAEDLRGIYNSGHSRGWPYARWNAARNQREVYNTFAMLVIAGIGDMPDTIEDRSIVISMRRRAPGEHVSQWRSRRVVPKLRDLRERLHDWVRGQVDRLGEAEPDLPAEDRAADVWEPLVAVADAAGGDWPDRARMACKALVGDDPDDGSAGERLLNDLWGVFEETPTLPTSIIIERLCELEESPWSTWHRGDKITPRALAELVKPYGVRSRNLKVHGSVFKGYARADMADAWSRYLRYSATSGPSPQVGAVADGVADGGTVAATHAEQPELAEVAAVAAVAPGRLERAIDYCRGCGMTLPKHTGSCKEGKS